MITTDEGLRVTIEQLECMYRILASYRSRKSTMHPSWYQVFTEGPIDEIRRLRAEIDEYLEITENEEAESSVSAPS